MNLDLNTWWNLIGVLVVVLMVLVLIEHLIDKKREVSIVRKERPNKVDNWNRPDCIKQTVTKVVKHRPVRRKVITKCKHTKRFV